MPPALADLLQHCFRSNPDERPRDMLEIVAVLQRLYARTTDRPRYHRERPQAAKARADSPQQSRRCRCAICTSTTRPSSSGRKR